MRFVQQIPRTETHEGGARDDRIRVHHVFRPEGLCHGLLLLSYVVSRDLVEVSADNDVGPPIETVCDQIRETLPIATRELLEGDNRHNGI